MLNVITIMGRLVDEPVIHNLETVSVSEIALAVNETKEKANFFDVKLFDSKAVAYLHKGDKVIIVGRLSQSTFTRKDGTKGNRIEIIANSVEFAEVKKPVEETK